MERSPANQNRGRRLLAAQGTRPPRPFRPAAPREAGQKWLRGDPEARGRGRQTVPPHPQELWHRAWCHLGGSCDEPELERTARRVDHAVFNKARDDAAQMPDTHLTARAQAGLLLPHGPLPGKCYLSAYFSSGPTLGGPGGTGGGGEPPQISTPPASRGCAMWQGGRTSQDGQGWRANGHDRGLYLL